jgi:serine/threonine protein kinase
LPSLAGTKLDKYEVLEEVGHGGMAVVYRGIDTVLKREVAVKVLHPHLADRAESRARLEREAIAVAKLRHENILARATSSPSSSTDRRSATGSTRTTSRALPSRRWWCTASRSRWSTRTRAASSTATSSPRT